MSKNTTVWGVVIAAGLVGATLALNAPGGSNSIAGRGITWAMIRLFPPRPAPAPPAAVPVPAPATPPGTKPLAEPAAPAAPEPRPEARPSRAEDPSAAIRRSAVRARANMAHAPTGVQFRKVYAVTVPGVFNGEAAGKPFLGFCGEISVPPGSWGRTGWKPFFVSETASTPSGQTPFLDMANPGTLAKCAGAGPAGDYSDIFGAGPTDSLLQPSQKHPLSAPAP